VRTALADALAAILAKFAENPVAVYICALAIADLELNPALDAACAAATVLIVGDEISSLLNLTFTAALNVFEACAGAAECLPQVDAPAASAACKAQGSVYNGCSGCIDSSVPDGSSADGSFRDASAVMDAATDRPPGDAANPGTDGPTCPSGMAYICDGCFPVGYACCVVNGIGVGVCGLNQTCGVCNGHAVCLSGVCDAVCQKSDGTQYLCDSQGGMCSAC
jgi:hypothetical protein